MPSIKGGVMDIVYLGLGMALALVTALAAWGCERLRGAGRGGRP
jgi:hypothetical protein